MKKVVKTTLHEITSGEVCDDMYIVNYRTDKNNVYLLARVRPNGYAWAKLDGPPCKNFLTGDIYESIKEALDRDYLGDTDLLVMTKEEFFDFLKEML